MSEWVYGAERAIAEVERAAYERGLRRGLAIVRENEVITMNLDGVVRWDAATEQMEREIEEAKR